MDESAKLKDLIERKKQLDQELAKFTKYVTVMFTDIVGSTSYFEKFGDVAGLVYVTKCIDMLSPLVERHHGTVCKTIGDAVMAYFDDPVDPVLAAIEMQRTLDAYNANQISAEQINVRIGLNYGPGMVKEKDVFGDAVNTAARVESLAKSQQVLVSTATKVSDEERAAWEQRLRDAGIKLNRIPDVTVKGKTEKIVVYEALWREMSGVEPVEVAPMAPQMAGRVNVAKAAEAPSDTGTVVPGAAPLPIAAMPKARFSLVLIRPDGTKGQECRLDKPVVMLGRVDTEILFPDDPLVSRRHARFYVSEKGVDVEDLNSANGIFWRLNKAHELRNGDTLLMGRQMFRFVSPRRDATPPPSSGAGLESATVLGSNSQAAGGMSAELIKLLPGGVEDQHFPLIMGENILGRTRGTITFPEDAYLSSQHCRIAFQNGGYVLEDMRAVNGTFVAIRERTALNDGDIILIGHQLLRVTLAAA